jgi:DNA-binding NtrC family response regulator
MRTVPQASLRWIPLCSSHELRRDFRDVLLAAGSSSLVASESFWAPLCDTRLDAMWSRDSPPGCAELGAAVRRIERDARRVLLIARSAVMEVAGELPAVDPLAANLRRLLRAESLQEGSSLFVCFDDRVRPCLGWIGHWPHTARLLDRLARLADETVPVLVRGETGTGKEMVARATHVLGRRRDKPYLAINCAELPETIVESELFGHVRGAFTGAMTDRAGLFEAAGEGTVFLDEIGELPLAAQAKLLRVLEEHRVRRLGSAQARPLFCRIVAATNRELATDVRGSRFRADLFYRLRGSEIVLPALRERREDVIALAELFATRAAVRFRRGCDELTDDAKVALLAHDWPGNIRELRQAIDVGALACPGAWIGAEHLALAPSAANIDDGGAPLLTARAVERAHILRALVSTSGNKMAAAKILGLTRQSLQRRMLRHGLVANAETGHGTTDALPESGARARSTSGAAKQIP